MDLAELLKGVAIALVIGSILVIFGSNINLPGFSAFVSIGAGIEIFAYFILFIGLLFALGEVFGAPFGIAAIISLVITVVIAVIVQFIA